MNCFDPDNDPEHRIGMLQHTLDSVLEHLHSAINRGEGRYVSLSGLVASRFYLENLMERLWLNADTQEWLLPEGRDGGSEDHRDY